MKTKNILLSLILSLLVSFVFGNETESEQYFRQAKQEIENMLAGKTPMSFERALFISENAFWQNQLSEEEFSDLISYHTQNIKNLIEANNSKTINDFKPTLLKSSITQLDEYNKALANYAIFLYMTDTTFFVEGNQIKYHLPYIYSNQDPLGTLDFTNTQVNKLLYSQQQQGNCFALSSLFKIFSDRLHSDAILCTAPGHVYIRHADDKGTYHNVELGSRSFPGLGSISALTYTTDQALRSDIAIRELTHKQAVGLSLIYLAKGYEYSTQQRASDFALACANTILQHDERNLNAMLLKAEVLESRLMAKVKPNGKMTRDDKEFIDYQNLIGQMFDYGYREMPIAQKQMIIEKLIDPESNMSLKNSLARKQINDITETKTASLTWGMLDEEMRTNPIEIYGNTAYNTQTKTIAHFLTNDNTTLKYPIDLVLFAWQIDPLAAKFPSMSPYAAFANNPIIYIDNDGREPKIAIIMNRDGNDFNEHISGLEKAGFIVIQVKNGQELISELNNHSSVNDPIDQLVILSHAESYGLIGLGSNENGFYTNEGVELTSEIKYGGTPLEIAQMSDPIIQLGVESMKDAKISRLKTENGAASIDDIKNLVNKGEVVFSKNAEIILGGCHSLIVGPDGQQIPNLLTIAGEFAKVANASVIASTSETSPVENQPARTGSWKQVTPSGQVSEVKKGKLDLTTKQSKK